MADRERLPRPAENDLLVGDEPGSLTEWIGTSPPIRSAVAFAVPDGASTFVTGWSSMISADGNDSAAASANRIISTAPSAKFGA